MMYRSPPAKQKRPSPSSSSLVHVKDVRQLATVTEIKSTPSPSKRLRRPPVISAEADEPFDLRSLQRGSPRSSARRALVTAERPLEAFPGFEYEDVGTFHHPEGDSEHELDWDSLRCSYKCRNLVKTDLITSLDSKEKQIVEQKALIDKMLVAQAAADEEGRRLKSRVRSMEQGLAAAKERENALYKQRSQESERAEEMLKTHISRCVELEAKLQEEMKRHAEEQARALALEARASAAEDAKDKDFRLAARETNKLGQELERAQMDGMLSVARLNAELEVKRAQAQSATAENRRLVAQLKDMQVHMDEVLAQRLKLEHQIYDVDIHTSSTHVTGAAEADLVIKHLKEELSQCEAENREAKKLKLKHANFELLKERLESEKARTERAEAALENLADLEMTVKTLEREVFAWKDMIATIPGVETCDDIPLKFAELQRDVVSAFAKVEESNAEMAKLRTAVELAENAKHQAETAGMAAEAEAIEARLNQKRADRKVSLLTKERDGLKAVLASYDEEDKVIASHSKSTAGIANLGTPEKVKDFRIQQLEQALADAQQQAKSLGEELETNVKSASDLRHKAESLSLMLVDAEEKSKAANREAGQLRSEISLLEAKVGRGESNPSTTKVLHMIINPEAEAHLVSEIQALRERLELHERHFDGCREEMTMIEGRTDKEDVNVLRQRVTALEKREARYKQVFANKISVFREACGLIFGYKVQMNEEKDSVSGSSITLFTLQSIYSTSEEEQIQFQFKAGNLEMIANEYTSSPELQHQVITFLRNYKSVPAFVANLTIEQFNKTTLS